MFEPLESRWLLTGYSGPALALDGVNDYATAPDHPTLDLGVGSEEDFTIEAFAYVPSDDYTGNKTLIYKQNAYALFFNQNGTFFRLWSSPISTDYVTLSSEQKPAAGWNHIAAVFDNEYTPSQDRIAIYLNGTLAAASTAVKWTPGINNSTSALNVGAYLGVNPFGGSIDELRFSDVVRYSGSSYTVPTSPFTPDAHTRALWHFDEPVGSTVFLDSSGNGNTLTGVNGAQTGYPPSDDTTPPTVVSLSPPDNATGVALNTNLIITFNENVQKGTGNIVLKKSSDNSVVETIAVTNAAVSISGATATIVRSTTLAETTGYYVEVASGAFKDLAGNNFAGITGPTAWNFTTGDFTAPTVVSLSPPDDATDVELDANLIITFNENVQKGTGNIVLKKSSDNSVVETIAVTSAAVTVLGATATIDLSTTLAASTGYYVEVASGAFADLAGNAFGGISGSTAWSFTTTGGIPPTVIDVSPSLAGGTLAAGTTKLRITFSEPVTGGDLAENYQLQSLGPDGLLGTVDDVIVPLSVGYSGTTATLTFAPLTESVYRLTLRDTITDLDGNPLDGDRDGNPGGQDQRHFVAIPPTGVIFVSGATHPTGNLPFSVTVGDFNGDGFPDLAVANSWSDNVVVLLGNDRRTLADFDSPGGFRFGVQRRGFGAGQLVKGSGNAFDGLGRLEVAGQTYGPTAVDDFLIDGGRTLLTQAAVIAQLYVSRKITVPAAGSQDFARTVEVLANPTDDAITTTVRIVGNLGSDGKTTVFATSSGDTLVETGDWWIGTDDDIDGGGTPAIVHLIHGPAGMQPTMVGLAGDLGDNIAWEYEITVPARETVRLAHFTILADTQAAAKAAAEVLVTPGGFGGQAAAFLNQDELDSLLNFQFELGSLSAELGSLSAELDSLSAELDDNDNLTITDIDATGKDNQLSIHNDGAGNLVISDANEQFTGTGGIPGASLSNANRTLTVPLASITGTKIIIHGAGGDDTLTVDLTHPLGKALDFHGGDGDDTLVLTGGSTHTSTFTYLSASDGSVALDPDGPGPLDPWTVTYTGLAPITSSIASDVVELIYTGGDETISISDAGGGQTTAVSTLGGLTTFTNPTESLRIVATSGTDTVNIGALTADYASIEIVGDDSTDVVNFNGPITFAADHSLTVLDVGTVNLPNTTSNITASGSGAVNITALGNIALASGASITTVDGDISLSANQQATPTAGTFTGISLNGASVTATGAGSITLAGRGGTEGENLGIQIQNDGQVNGTTGTSSITLVADSMTLTSNLSVNAGSNAVVLRPHTAGTRIDLGGADVLSGTPLTLGLTDAELDRIIAGTLTIGDAASGPITISAAINRPSATNVHLISGGGIVFDPGSIDTGGGTLVLDPGTAVQPLTAGTDVTASTLSFADGAQLAIQINGTSVDTGYSQLNQRGRFSSW